jgi:hypothetical protein
MIINPMAHITGARKQYKRRNQGFGNKVGTCEPECVFMLQPKFTREWRTFSESPV